MVHSGPWKPAGQLPGQLQEVLSGIERQASSNKQQAATKCRASICQIQITWYTC